MFVTCCRSLTSDDPGATLITIDHDSIEFTITGASPNTVSLTSLTSALNNGQWHHIVVTYSHAPNRLHVFVDEIRVTLADGMTVSSSNANNFTDV